MNQARKEDIFMTLLKTHKAQLYRICWGFSQDQNEVNDLYQESLLRIWKGLESFKGEASLSTWAYRITVNVCIYVKKRNTRSRLFAFKESENPLQIAPPIEDEIVKSEGILQLKQAIQQLNKVDRSIILLVLEECSYKEIAEIIGISVSNVGVKISRIKAKLKQLLIQTHQ